MTPLLMITALALPQIASPSPPTDPWLIAFAKGDAAIVGEQATLLGGFASSARTSGTFCVTLIGRADADEGSRRGNLLLSRRRAEAVNRFLMRNGFPSRGIRVLAVGDRSPLMVGSQRANRTVAGIFSCPNSAKP